MGHFLCAALLALNVIVGDWRVEDGALKGEVAAAGEKKRPIAAALLGPEGGARPASIDVTVSSEAEEKRKAANAFVLFDVERDAAGRISGGRFAGLFLGGKRAAIGTIARGGRPVVDVDASCDVRPGRAYKLSLALADGAATLSVDGVVAVTATAAPRAGGGAQGLMTLGAARFDDVVMRGKDGAILFEDRFEAYTDGMMPGAPPGGDMMGGAEGARGGAEAMKPGADAMKPGADAMKPTPMSAPAQPSFDGGGYAGGPLGKTPGLDGPLPPESMALSPDARRLVRRRFLDLLGRGPTEAEVLAASKAGETAAVDALLRSQEFWRNWYEEELYFFLLIDQFRPTDGSLASLPDRLASGSVEPRSALAEIVISQYFAARNPGNDTFVTVIMEQVVGLKVQEKANAKDLDGGKKMFDGYPAAFLGEKGDSQADIVKIAFAKRAMSERYIERLHRRIVGSEIAAPERSAAAERFERAPAELPAIIRAWVLSPAYASASKYPREKTDAQWIRTLYADLLGARPDYREFRDTRNALLALADSTPIRRVLGKVVVDSKKSDRAAAVGADGKRWIEERFLLLLGRGPRAEEAAAFEEVLRESGPRIVLQALVQSREYQSY